MPHYAAHLSSIWWALPPEMRGTFYASGLLAQNGDGEGLPGWKIGHPPPGDRPCLVAGWVDELSCDRPVIYLEHGAGQSYAGDPAAAVNSSYSGSQGHERVVLFLAPSERVAGRWRRLYPQVPAVAVGCPRMDRWHTRQPRHHQGVEVVAFTFHSDSAACPETRTALPHYEGSLPAVVSALRAQGRLVLGHGHPRIWGRAARLWAALSVEAVRGFDEILARADVLCVDNSSAGVEFASTGRPVVWMNAPWYRREVQHGQRFWDWVDGQIQVDHPWELPSAINEALTEPAGVRGSREAMVADAYVATDGQATARAVAAIKKI